MNHETVYIPTVFITSAEMRRGALKSFIVTNFEDLLVSQCQVFLVVEMFSPHFLLMEQALLLI